jgi:hypothetical protein
MPTKKQFQTLMRDATTYCEDYRSVNIDPAHRKADDAYHGVLENLQDYIDRNRSCLFIPKTQTRVDKWTKTLVNSFYLSDDIVTAQYSLDEGKERFTNEVLNRRLEAQTTFFMFLVDFSHATVKYGNGVGKTGWEYSETTDKAESTDPDTGEVSVTETTSPVVDKPFFEVVPFEQIQVDYRCTSINPAQDSPFFRHWNPMYVTDVQQKFDSKEWRKPKGKVDWDKLSEGPWTLDVVRKTRQGGMADPTETNVGSGSDGPALSYRQVWVVENYFRSGGTDWTFISLGDEHIVTEPERVTDKFVHKKRPFSITKYNPEAFRVVSSGLPILMSGLQDETNATRNQRRDNVARVLNKEWLVRRGAGIQLSSLINSRTGAVHLGDQIGEEAIREVPCTDVTASGYREEEINNRDIDEVSGHSANTLGVEAPDRQTATASAIAASSAGEDEAFRIKCFIETGVRPLLEMFYDNVVAMENDPDVLAFAAVNTGLPPDETLIVRGELVINAGMGATNKELRASKYERGMSMLTQLAGASPENAGKFLGYADMIMKQWLPLMGIKNLELKNAQEAQPTEGAAGTPPGAETGPSPALPAASTAPGISPELSMEVNSTPGMGGFARGMLQ